MRNRNARKDAMELKPPYEDWKPGEYEIRHNERGHGPNARIERWQWSRKKRSWKLTAVFAAMPGKSAA